MGGEVEVPAVGDFAALDFPTIQRATVAVSSPAAIRGSHSCFCSSVPKPSTDLPKSPFETDTIPRRAESARPSSSMPRT